MTTTMVTQETVTARANQPVQSVESVGTHEYII